jgi:Ankyrin repeats (3 copies)
MTAKPQPGKKAYSHAEICSILDDESTSAAEMQKFIAAGPDCDQYFGYEGILLSTAIEYQDVAVVKLLLANGAGPNHTAGIQHRHPLYFAAEEGDPAVAQALIERGAKVQDARALLAAASYLHNDVIMYPPEVGAPLEERTDEGELGPRSQDAPGLGTTLHAAVRAQYAEPQDNNVLDGERHLGAVKLLSGRRGQCPRKGLQRVDATRGSGRLQT